MKDLIELYGDAVIAVPMQLILAGVFIKILLAVTGG